MTTAITTSKSIDIIFTAISILTINVQAGHYARFSALISLPIVYQHYKDSQL